jgi:adenylate cyclase
MFHQGLHVSDQPAKRTLTTIFYADVVEYSRLTGLDEEGTHSRVMEILDNVSQKINSSGGKVLRYAGDAILATFPSVVQAVEISTDIQSKLVDDNAAFAEQARVHIRIGINLGDVIEDRGEVFGDGVNLAARLEANAEPGGICISSMVWEQCQGKISSTFVDGGEQQFKNINRPVRTFHWEPGAERSGIDFPNNNDPSRSKPSIAVLPFDNMSGDPEQEYFSDGITEDIITEISRFRSLFVIARNSSFAFKGQAIDVTDVAEKLGVQYVVEGSVRKAGERIRITAQLIEASTGIICGRNGTTGTWRTSSRFKTRSLRKS